MLVLLTRMMMAVNYQETIDERVSFRLGEEIARLNRAEV